ncbi:hypothetical protein N781_00245 [Pontibacillus halophilus JSM 076056 = DSM 19796]|uniref:Sporulation protein n=1 Tax=Pontibacillus halophilus JSM 076056 = DSM 19796 TaxID=1385510 RepID=A0A0A5GR91_9BACI|nr:spore protease YyaC [Pontibacillus halophilus]KGX93685.1 hypothetical protein N781_00245 [Pontibacillus halophilus JSM 076056 = DSM 19796]
MNLKQRFFHAKPEERFHYEDDLLLSGMTEKLLEWVPSNRDLVLVCIGTDRSTGDSFGPLLGSLLEEKRLNHVHVYGTLDEPVHAVNLEEKLQTIGENHQNPFIIGIDACLGKVSSVGSLIIGKGPVKPGAAVKKQLPEVGELHITGVVNVSGFMEYFVLQNTRLNLVMHMSKRVAQVIQSYDRKRGKVAPKPQITLQTVKKTVAPWSPVKE